MVVRNKLLAIAAVSLLAFSASSLAQQVQSAAAPIIDMHLHALTANSLGPPPIFICAPYSHWPAWDPKSGKETYADMVSGHPPCEHPLSSPKTDDELMEKTLAIMRARNVIGVTAGSEKRVGKWKQAGGDRILPAVYFDPVTGQPTVDELRRQIKGMRAAALAEISNQYEGVSVTDARMEPYYALAEELDLPMGIHMGPGPPGAPYIYASHYRMKLSSLLLLEDVLTRHPKLRVYAMHAGWPLIDDAIAALYAHPQLYVDIGVISYAFPRKDFYGYLHRLIDAGFEDRILFGSDEMVWPEALSAAIDTIQNDPGLSEREKRDIFFNNAVRFLRLHERRGEKLNGPE